MGRSTQKFTFIEKHFLGLVLVISTLLFTQENFFHIQNNAPIVNPKKSLQQTPLLYSKNIFTCSPLCYRPPERTISQAGNKVRSVKHRGITRVSDIPKNLKNPNAIRISIAEAPPILSNVKMVNGRPTCAKKNDKGHKSDKYDHPHIDQQCCLDPDEIPNPRCLYQ